MARRSARWVISRANASRSTEAATRTTFRCARWPRPASEWATWNSCSCRLPRPPGVRAGTVDAWAIRDPFLAAIEIDIPVRVIADGASVGVSNYQFYHATRELRERHPAVIAAILKEIATVDKSAKQDVPRIAAVLAPSIGMKTEAVERALGRMGFGVRPLDGDVVGEQQRLADAFFAAILIPRKIDVSAVVSTALF